jgi:aspartate/methionine/tyrosine aminotransferase
VIDDIAVTNSGMSALMLVTQALIGPGDRVVAVTPLWPNLVEIPKIFGATVECVALEFGRDGWTLDLDRLLTALGPGTRAVYINSPNNPTGWTLTRDEQRAILAHCRRHGIWIIADDAYERLYFGGGGAGAVAPSFLALAQPDDQVISTNTFSKSWLMTGWRLGWIVAPPSLVPDLAKLLEYNTSCAPPFVQRAGVVAVTDGEPVIARTAGRLRQARDFLHGHLARMPGVEAVRAVRGDVAFFRVERRHRQPRLLQAPGRRGGTRPRPRKCVRSGRRGLRSLVLRVGRVTSRGRRRAVAAISRARRRVRLSRYCAT